MTINKNSYRLPRMSLEDTEEQNMAVGSTTPATGSDRCWVSRNTLPSTCGPCPIGRWVRLSGTRCGDPAALPAAKLAFELLVLTAARWGEVRVGRVGGDRSQREGVGPFRPGG